MRPGLKHQHAVLDADRTRRAKRNPRLRYEPRDIEKLSTEGKLWVREHCTRRLKATMPIVWFVQLARLRRPRLPPSGRCASTSRSCASSLSLSMWWTRTCLRSSISVSEYIPRANSRTSVDYQAWDICALGLDRTGTRSQETGEPGHAESFHSSA